MANLEVQRIVGRTTPWGVYRLAPTFNPTRIVRHLYWTVRIYDGNGTEVVSLDRQGARYVRLPAPGVYTAVFTVTKHSDRSAVLLTKNYTIEATNEPPAITYKRADALSDWRGNHVAFVEIVPTDPDGRIAKIEISACGQTKPYTRAIINCKDAQSVDVHVRVCDDAGACTEDVKTISW